MYWIILAGREEGRTNKIRLLHRGGQGNYYPPVPVYHNNVLKRGIGTPLGMLCERDAIKGCIFASTSQQLLQFYGTWPRSQISPWNAIIRNNIECCCVDEISGIKENKIANDLARLIVIQPLKSPKPAVEIFYRMTLKCGKRKTITKRGRGQRAVGRSRLLTPPQ